MEEVVRQGSIKLAQLGEALGIKNLDPDPGMIFVTGGAGVIGHRVSQQLVQEGHPIVRLGVKNPDEHRNKDNEEILEELVEFSWDRQETFASALKGVKSVLCTIPYHENWYAHFPEFLQACINAGVRHFIKLSFYHATKYDEFNDVPLVKHHAECDELLMDTITPALVNVMTGASDVSMDLSPHMSYTILYASHLMSNPFLFYKQELLNSRKPATFYGSSGNHGVNYVSPNDIAEVAVRVLLEPRAHFNCQYTLTGPEAITDQQVAHLLGKHLGKAVMYVNQPLHEFESELKTRGMEDWKVRDLVELEKIKQTGHEEGKAFLTDDIEKICGRAPETFEAYLGKAHLMSKLEIAGPTELLKTTIGNVPKMDPPASHVEATA